MAYTEIETTIANPARKAGKKRRNMAMSLKQKLHFGSKRQRAAAREALKRKKKTKRAASHRRRSNPSPVAKRKTSRKRTHRRRTNPGELIAITLGNPARKKGKKMARKAKRKTSHRRKSNAGRRRARRHNPAPVVRRRRRHNTAKHRRSYRRNPGQMGNLVKSSVAVIGGAVGSKMITQMVLGSSNTGIMGYLGNAVATGLLAWGSKAVLKDHAISQGVILGGAVQIVLRAISDFTPYGQVLSLSGLGDYMALPFVTPQRLNNGLSHNASIAIPQGWGASSAVPVAVQSAGGMSGRTPNWD